MIDWKKKSFVPFAITGAGGMNQSGCSCINGFGKYRVVLKSGKKSSPVCPGMLLSELKIFSRTAPKLLELRVGDMLLNPESCSGVYIFSDNSGILYVGKCTSKPFIERIGSHLAPRSCDYFNCYVKAIYRSLEEEDYENLEGIDNVLIPEVLNVLQDTRVTFIPYLMDNVLEKNQVGEFERALIKTLNPLYQNRRGDLCKDCQELELCLK